MRTYPAMVIFLTTILFFSHAVHILAMAIEKAGTTDRSAVRKAPEEITDYDELINYYKRPFTKKKRSALFPEDLFMGRFKPGDGDILRIAD